MNDNNTLPTADAVIAQTQDRLRELVPQIVNALRAVEDANRQARAVIRDAAGEIGPHRQLDWMRKVTIGFFACDPRTDRSGLIEDYVADCRAQGYIE